jgi:streptomycin 6-kinase
MNLPADFISNIRNAFHEEGYAFLKTLPDQITEISARWGLTDVQPVPNLSYNFVAYAYRREANVILKMSVPNRESISEMQALSLFNGQGACRLLESDQEKCYLLLERLRPGENLSTVENDDEATHIACEVMRNLWRPVPENNKFIKLSDWFDGLKKIRPHFDGETGPFPKELLERVESFLPELFAEKDVKLMHGDFHHFNILSSERGWLAIDPKGVVGPLGYEIGPFMMNPWNSISDARQIKARPERSRRIRAERRVSILSERFGWEREKIIKWATAHAVLSTWWSIEDGREHEYSMQCAKIFSEIK